MYWYQQLQPFLKFGPQAYSFFPSVARDFYMHTCLNNSKGRAGLCANPLLTSDSSVKGHAHATHSVVGCSCDLASASSSMSAEKKRNRSQTQNAVSELETINPKQFTSGGDKKRNLS